MTSLSLRLVVLLALAHAIRVTAAEDIEYVQEHLAEVPMDNRFATLPVWNSVLGFAIMAVQRTRAYEGS